MLNRILPILVMTLVCVVACLAVAGTRQEVPPNPYAPIYARPVDNHDLDIIAWIFYRSPQNIPADFDLSNLMDFKDRNDNGVIDPYEVPLLVEGFVVYKGEINWMTPPRQMEIHESWDPEAPPMEIWFTSHSEPHSYESVTIEQLENMESLVRGTITYYRETLQPVGGHQVPKWNYLVMGVLDDGRSFRLHTEGTYYPNSFYYRMNMWSLIIE